MPIHGDVDEPARSPLIEGTAGKGQEEREGE